MKRETIFILILALSLTLAISEGVDAKNKKGRCDLIVRSLSAPSSADAGKSIKIASRVKNKGQKKAKKSYTKYYLSKNRKIDSDDYYLGKVKVSPLKNRKTSKKIKRNVTIPSSVPAGKYYLIAMADGTKRENEESEKNNYRRKKITIGSRGSGGNDYTSGGPQPEPPTVHVDQKIQPSIIELPGFNDKAPRPLASLADSKGNQADFVENEIWLSTDDSDVLNKFLKKWGGKVISTFDPKKNKLTGIEAQYLVRIDTSIADTSRLTEDLLSLDPESRGEHTVSSEAGHKLLSAAAKEAARGLLVGVNWVGQGSTFRDRDSSEASTGGLSAASDQNVFNWPTHNTGSTQDIGVAEAWRTLELAGNLDNKVDIAILDMGFQPDSDFPYDGIALSNVPFVTDPLGVSNLSDCGSPCPWHGTNVVSAAMAVPDNDFGSAGPAGPVADPIMVFTSYDFFTSITAISQAVAAGADIVNMSYGARVPASLSWSVVPFDITTIAFRTAGILMFAAAGNDGANVDAEDCLFWGICWEEAWHTPCENNGVICVGGLAWDSKSKARGSNYGGENVDIFAPYTLWLGPDPVNTGNINQWKNGTSFSSPFTAGVAALIWAADPGLSAGEVESILYRTAHTSPDRRVNRYVNAFGAVAETLGDVSPYIRIMSPSNGDSFLRRAESVSFSADAEDLEDGTPDVSWYSSIDGRIGNGVSFSRTDLSFGTHTITATATDSAGNSEIDTVNITIVNAAPTVTINHVSPGTTISQSRTLSLGGTSYDPSVPGSLNEDQVSWYLDGSYSHFATGHSSSIAGGTLGIGEHTVTFKGTDGVTMDEDHVTITVIADPPSEINIPPTAVINSPDPGASFFADKENAHGKGYANVTLCGYGDDPEDGEIHDSGSVFWYALEEGESVSRILASGAGEGFCPNVKLYLNDPYKTTYTIKLLVRDSNGEFGEAEITVSVYGLI